MSALIEKVCRDLLVAAGEDPDRLWQDGRPVWKLSEPSVRIAIKAVAEWLKAEDQAETSEARRMIFKELEGSK